MVEQGITAKPPPRQEAKPIRFQLRPRPRPGFLCGVPKLRGFLKYWLPLLLWLAVIFAASADQQSAQHSSRIIAPLLRWLFPNLPQQKVNDLVFLARKGAHVTEYGVMAWLVWRALRKPARNDPRPWKWREAGVAWGCIALIAVSDELHQAFVPTREPSPWDVLIDVSGAALGLLALWLFWQWRKSRRRTEPAGSAVNPA
jgi:VanZ family protein